MHSPGWPYLPNEFRYRVCLNEMCEINEIPVSVFPTPSLILSYRIFINNPFSKLRWKIKAKGRGENGLPCTGTSGKGDSGLSAVSSVRGGGLVHPCPSGSGQAGRRGSAHGKDCLHAAQVVACAKGLAAAEKTTDYQAAARYHEPSVSRTLAARFLAENGFWIKWIPSSRTP